MERGDKERTLGMCVSRKLRDVEQRYTNTEREALAVLWALKRLAYIYDTSKLIVLTDHQPLLGILKKDTVKDTASARLERYRSELKPHIRNGTRIQYLQGALNPADLFSRLPEEGGEIDDKKSASSSARVDPSIDLVANVVVPDKPWLEGRAAILRWSDILWVQQRDTQVQTIMGDMEEHGSEEYAVVEGVLCRQWKGTQADRLLRVFLPQELRHTAMQAAHGLPHSGYEVMLQVLKQRVFWPTMRADIKDFLERCQPCAERGVQGKKGLLDKAEIPTSPWQVVGLDLLQLPETGKGYKYLLVGVDLLSRYAIAKPLKSKMSITVAKAVLSEIIEQPMLGPPQQFLTDQGCEFMGASFQELCLAYGIKHTTTATANAKGNGVVERMNRTIMHILRVVCQKGPDWDKHIPAALKAYNNLPHSTVGLAPSQVWSGRVPRLENLLPDWPSEELQDNRKADLGAELLAHFEGKLESAEQVQDFWAETERIWEEQRGKLQERLRQHIERERERQHRAANKHREAMELQPGQEVLLEDRRRPQGVEGKLHRRYRGGHRIVQVHDGVTATVTGRRRRVPLDQIRPLHG